MAAVRSWQTHDGLEATLAFVDFGCALAGDSHLDRVIHVGCVEPVTCNGRAVDVDHEILLTADAVYARILRPPDGRCDLGDFLCLVHEGVKVVAENLHRDVCTYAGNHFVDAIGDRLRHYEIDSRQHR